MACRGPLPHVGLYVGLLSHHVSTISERLDLHAENVLLLLSHIHFVCLTLLAKSGLTLSTIKLPLIPANDEITCIKFCLTKLSETVQHSDNRNGYVKMT